MNTQENTAQNNSQINNNKIVNNLVQVIIPAPEKSSRLLAVATLFFFIPKMILIIPHIIVLHLLGIVAFVFTVIGQIAVIINGKYPDNIHKIVVGILRWQVRVNAYALGLRDEYPPFTLDN